MTSRHAGVWPHPADMKTCLANPALQFPACSLHAVRIHFSVPCGSGICNSRWQIQHSVLNFFCSFTSEAAVSAACVPYCFTSAAASAASVLQLHQHFHCCSNCVESYLPSCFSSFCVAAASAAVLLQLLQPLLFCSRCGTAELL